MAIPISNAALRRLGCGLREVLWLRIPEAPVVLEAKVLPDDAWTALRKSVDDAFFGAERHWELRWRLHRE
ncbi:MAG TPA: hypothetical protein VJ323_18185 [Bryobacteraceae bacterium]|nr:hypothetical protein [Bryobacteraceae bacterium]